MLKKLFLIGIITLFAPVVMAQEVFWGFGEDNRELIIPPECDSSLTSQELLDAGMRLLEETGYAKQGAPYCLLAAALDNHPEAQYQVARLYQKGILLPKSELAAYKWATVAALNGHADADRLGASIEQFLSIQDIEASTKSLQNLIPTINEAVKRDLEDEIAKQEKIKEGIEIAKTDARDLKKYGKMKSSSDPLPYSGTKAVKEAKAEDGKDKQAAKPAKKKTEKSILTRERENRNERAKANESIFSQEDLDNAPMPSNG
ncbi:MAG: sel1 repeat family protein [Alphaproteobacteria bacterium]|nr:sel1 repeat family protein [Alphaproteobacteria bacterium]